MFDNKATDAFLSCLKTLMDFAYSHGHHPECLVAVEKRINFTIEDLEARAPAYEYFLQFVQKSNECDGESANSSALFEGTQLAVDEIPMVSNLPHMVHCAPA